MAARPNVVPRWAAQAPSGGVIQPPAGLANTGWQANQRPPAPVLNWMQALNGQWSDWLRGADLGSFAYLQFANLTVGTLPAFSALARRGVVIDTVTQPYGTPPQPAYRYAVPGIASGAVAIYVSRTGDTWEALPGGSLVGMYGTHFNGLSFAPTAPGRWLAYGDDDAGHAWMLTTPADGGSGTSGINPNAAHAWTAASLPSGTGTVYIVTASPDGQYVALSNTGILYSGDGLTWTLAATGAGVGNWVDVVWTGSAFVALTLSGQIWAAPANSGPWTLATTLPSATDINISAGAPGMVAVWSYGGGTIHLSTNDGATWTSLTPSVGNFLALAYDADGCWIARTNGAPYLASSNDLVNFVPLPVPYVETVTGVEDNLPGLAYADGRWIAPTYGHVLVSGHASDLGTGIPYAPGAPAMLMDAGAIRGIPIDPSAQNPANGDTLVYSAASGLWLPSTVAPADLAWTPTTDGAGTTAAVAAGAVTLTIAASTVPATNGPKASIPLLGGTGWEFTARIASLTGLDANTSVAFDILSTTTPSGLIVGISSNGSALLVTTLGGGSNLFTLPASSIDFTGKGWLRVRYQHGVLVMYYGTGLVSPAVAPPTTWTRLGPLVTTPTQTADAYQLFDVRLFESVGAAGTVTLTVDHVTFTAPGP